MLWSVEKIGKGHSSPSISKGVIYITGITEAHQEVLTAIDLNGNILWQTEYSPAWEKTYPEARTAPTVDDDRVYVISGTGKVVCVDAQMGNEKWAVAGREKFGAENGRWGTAESPLIVDDKVIYTPAGNQTTLVALDKLTGKTVWTTKSLNDDGAYVSPILVQKNNRKLIVAVTANYIIGINAENGDIWWHYDYVKQHATGRGATINTITPVYWNGQIFVTSGYDHGGVMLKLTDDLTQVSFVWFEKNLDTHHGGVIVVDGYIYGTSWLGNQMGNWLCLDWNTGSIQYEKEWKNKGSLIYADDMLYCYEEKGGTIALVKASPHDFEIVSSFKVPLGSGPAWTHPVISAGRLYLRRGEALMVFDIKAKP